MGKQSRKITRQKEKEEAKQAEVRCPGCKYPNFFTNPVLQQIGLVICGNVECGMAYCPFVGQLIERELAQKKAAEEAQVKGDKAMSQEEFEKFREENKELIIKPS